MPKDLWKDNKIQFARLIAEINSVGLSKKQYKELGESMDLSITEINELFDRAIEEFEKSKKKHCPIK